MLPTKTDGTIYHLIPESQRFTKDELARLYKLVVEAEHNNSIRFRSEGNSVEDHDAYMRKVKLAEIHLLQYKVMCYLAAEDSRLLSKEMETMFGEDTF